MRKNKKRSLPKAVLFAQPPPDLYRRTTLYQCGSELEIEHFRSILSYGEEEIKIDLGGCILVITGEKLAVVSLEKERLRLNGVFFKLEYSYTTV